jgi:hypothetical protein
MQGTSGNKQVALTDDVSANSETPKSTRRTALRLTGSGVALALFASRLDGRVSAQEASPEAGTSRVGAYAVVRTRKLKPETAIDSLSAAIRDGLMPQIEQIPGFIDYYVVQNFDTLERSSVSIFADKEGTDASTKLAGEFLNGQGLADLYEDVNPVITEGEIVVASDKA